VSADGCLASFCTFFVIGCSFDTDYFDNDDVDDTDDADDDEEEEDFDVVDVDVDDWFDKDSDILFFLFV
jgi:hypothetical protein